MANWKHSINIYDLLNQESSDEVAVAVGKAVADRVEAVIPECSVFSDPTLRDILDRLRNHAVDEEELNYLLDLLYDWGDYNHRLCVGSFMPASEIERLRAQHTEHFG